MPPRREKLRRASQAVEEHAQRGDQLRDQRRPRRATHAHAAACNQHNVQRHVDNRRYRKERKRRNRVAHASPRRRQVVVRAGREDARKHDHEIARHAGAHLLRHAHPQKQTRQQAKGQPRQRQRGACADPQRGAHRAAHALAILHAEELAEHHAAPHAQTQHHTAEQYKQRKGSAHRRQRILPDIAAHHPCVHHIVHLLKQVARHQRQAEAKQPRTDRAARQIHHHKSPGTRMRCAYCTRLRSIWQVGREADTAACHFRQKLAHAP